MCVYLRTKFQVFSIILMSFRWDGGEGQFSLHPSPPAEREGGVYTLVLFYHLSNIDEAHRLIFLLNRGDLLLLEKGKSTKL